MKKNSTVIPRRKIIIFSFKSLYVGCVFLAYFKNDKYISYISKLHFYCRLLLNKMEKKFSMLKKRIPVIPDFIVDRMILQNLKCCYFIQHCWFSKAEERKLKKNAIFFVFLFAYWSMFYKISIVHTESIDKTNEMKINVGNCFVIWKERV